MYRVPEHLSGELDLELRRGNCRTQRSKHPWINLEDRLWRLLPHEVWTDDPERATFFVVPHAFLGHRCAGVQSLEQRYLWRGLSPFLEYLYYAQPFFNRSHGRDHVTTWILENGVQCDCSLRSNLANESLAVDILKSVAKVGYWGHHDAAMFGWQPGFDIAMPQFGAVNPLAGQPPRWEEVVSTPKLSFGFSGSYWGSRVSCPASVKGSPPGSLGAAHSCECSPDTRTWLKSYLLSNCNSSSTPTTRCSGLSARMGTFLYALCPAAWACWSSRLYHAIDRLVVPVIMANGAIQPFETLLDWQSFAVRIDTRQLIANNVSQLDWLHRDALAVSKHCGDCPTCDACTRLPLVRRVRQLERVRSWLVYGNGTASATGRQYNALGLFLVELHCRQLHRRGGGDGVCGRFPHARAVHGASHAEAAAARA